MITIVFIGLIATAMLLMITQIRET